MLNQTISNLNFEQLKTLIIKIVDERLKQQNSLQPSQNKQQLQQLFDSIDRNLWTPPAFAPSTLAILREDRDRR